MIFKKKYQWLFVFLLTPILWGQSILHLPPAGATAGSPLTLEVIVDGKIKSARLYHRTAGTSGYQEQNMIFDISTWKAVIPGNFIVEEGLEYAIIFSFHDGSVKGFPANNSMASPHLVNVSPASLDAIQGIKVETTRRSAGPKLASQVLVLSPNEGEVVLQEDILIAVSLFSVDGVDINKIKFFLDGRDITSSTEISSDLITYIAPKLDVGLHTVNIEITNRYGYELEPTTWSFMVGGTGSRIAEAVDEFSYSAKVRSDFSVNQVSGTSLSIGETTTTIEGGWDWFKLRTLIKYSTEENLFSQPRNRISTTIRSSDFVTIHLGDFTPVINPYLVEGKRVRGIGTNIDLRWLTLQTVSGELERPIQGYLSNDRSYLITDINTDSSGAPQYILDRRGYTFGRQYMAGRLSISLFERISLGIFGQKAKDDKGSVLKNMNSAKFTVPDWEGAISTPGINPGLYTLSEFENSLEGIGSIQLKDKGWGGQKPMDNLVAGFDFGLNFDNRRLILESTWAMSMLNRDIWNGPMSIAQMDTSLDDSLDGYIGRSYDDLGSIVSGGISTQGLPDPTKFEDIFIANINMTPLVPIDYQALDDTPFAALLNMPSSAYNIKTRAFYYGNTIEMKYSQVGPQFTSLANPYLSSNLREFVFSDRFRLFDNKLSIGFEFKSRNNKILRTVIDPYKQKISTTTFGFAPGAGMPSFAGSFKTISRTNEKTTLDTLLYSSYTGEDSISFRDNRENMLTKNRFISVSIPISENQNNFNFLVTYNSTGIEDLLKSERSSNYIQKATSSEALSIVSSAKFVSSLKLTFSFSQYIVQIPLSGISLSDNESNLTTIAGNGSYDVWDGKAKINAGLSIMNATGASKFNFIGINGGGELNIFGGFFIRATVASKIKSNDKGTELGTLALKISANYIF
ncbi:MAG: hypothetical protein CMG75_09995 [Candidatus Marinimicrobia bacterium]|nr:hypothetical protein [Candidatus Neomarinimicrobiota bacterium]